MSFDHEKTFDHEETSKNFDCVSRLTQPSSALQKTCSEISSFSEFFRAQERPHWSTLNFFKEIDLKRHRIQLTMIKENAPLSN